MTKRIKSPAEILKALIADVGAENVVDLLRAEAVEIAGTAQCSHHPWKPRGPPVQERPACVPGADVQAVQHQVHGQRRRVPPCERRTRRGTTGLTLPFVGTGADHQRLSVAC